MRKLSWQDIQSKDNYINLAVAIEEAGGASEVVLQAERTLEELLYALECNSIELTVEFTGGSSEAR
jgi:hypothetical protein